MSEVNCKSSAKYWFRNDALYKATTTTSTTTTTIAPPTTRSTTTQPPERPFRRHRPTRRRRPQQDYYDDYEEYDNDYPEEPPSRRHKPSRPRNRRPEYDEEDDYDAPRRLKDPIEDVYEDRPVHRNRERERERSRPRDDEMDDYELYERRSYDRYRGRGNRPTEGRRYKDEERRPTNRRPHSEDGDRRTSESPKSVGHNDRRASMDDRRMSHEDLPRRAPGRRPHSSRTPVYDDAEEEEEDFEDLPPRKHASNRDEVADDRPLKRAQYKPPELKSGVVPKVRSSSSAASIFSRPRPPPRINRPVPVNERKKYEYIPQVLPKSTTTTAASPASDELYDDYDYDIEPLSQAPKVQTERPRKIESKPPTPERKAKPEVPTRQSPPQIDNFEFDEYESEVSDTPNAGKLQRTKNESVPSVPTPTKSSAPAKSDATMHEEKQPAIDDFGKDDFEDEEEFEDYAEGDLEMKRIPAAPKRTGNVENERKILPSTSSPLAPLRIPLKTYDTPIESPKETERLPESPQQSKTNLHRLSLPNFNPKPVTYDKPTPSRVKTDDRDVYSTLNRQNSQTLPAPSGFKSPSFMRESVAVEVDSDQFKTNRPVVRVMKRPFLPSRGGNPYLPRGLKPVGAVADSSSIEDAPIYLKNPLPINFDQRSPAKPIQSTSTAYNSQPNVRVSFNGNYGTAGSLRPTQTPQIETPRNPLDDIYNSDYDVTINDALNPTLKPITQSHESGVAYSLPKFDRSNPYSRADVSQSPSQYRSTAVQAPLGVHQQSRQRRPTPAQTTQPFYDDYEY